MKSKANLFIVGAAKCGTTSLYEYLRQFPNVFMSRVKEPHFFSDTVNNNSKAYEKPEPNKDYHTRIITDKSIYDELFKGREMYQYRGEASPHLIFGMRTQQKKYKHIILMQKS